MKKRRELDALVNGKTNGRRKRKGQHDLLLENMSDSSEIEEFSVPGKTVVRKRGFCQFCATCITLCGFFVLVGCVSAIIGLVWVHIELKQELDDLKTELNQVRSSQENQDGNQEEISDLRSKVAALTNQLETLNSGSISNVKKSMTEHSAKLAQLDERINVVETDVNQKSIPKEFTDLQQNSLSLRSDLATAQEDIRNLQVFQSDINERFDNLRVRVDEIGSSNSNQGDAKAAGPDPALAARVESVERAVERVNTSLDVRIIAVTQVARDSQALLTEVARNTSALQSEVTLLKLTTTATPPPSDHTPPPSNPDTSAVQALIQDALQNYTLGGKSSTDLSAYNASVQGQLDLLQNRLGIVEEQAFTDMVSQNVFLAFQQTTETQYQSVSHSVEEVDARVDTLEARVQQQYEDLQLVHAQISSEPSSALEGNPDEEPEDQEGTDKTGDEKPADENSEPQLGGDDGHVPEWLYLDTTPASAAKSQEENAGTTAAAEEDEWTSGVMTNDHVTSAQDVEFEFYKWDVDQDDYVTYDDIRVFYGPNMAAREELAHFDFDGDKRYSLTEMQAAFGYQPSIYGPQETSSRAPVEGSETEDRFKRHVEHARQQRTRDRS